MENKSQNNLAFYKEKTGLSYSQLGKVLGVHKTTAYKISQGKLQPGKKLDQKINKSVKKLGNDKDRL